MHERIVFKRIFSLLLCFSLLFSSFALAIEFDGDNPSDGPKDEAEESVSSSLSGTVSSEISSFNAGEGAYATIKQIAGIMLWLAIAICVFKMIQIGIKFMTSGTGKGKQEAKASLLPFLIGAIICFAFVTIGSTIIDVIVSGMSGGVFDV